MKKTLKRTCAIALAVAATAGISGVDKVIATNKVVESSSAVVYADAEITAGVLKVTNYSKTAKVGIPYTMPTAVYGGNAVTSFKVTAPSGATVTPDASGKLSINEIGTYTITYQDATDPENVVELGSVTFTSSVTNYGISLEQNTANTLPSKIGTSFSGKMNFPKPVIDGVENNDDYKIVVKLQTPYGTKDVTADAEGNYSYTFAENELEAGLYTATYYVYYKGSNDSLHLVNETSREFRCVEGTAYEAGAKMTLSYSSEKPASLNIGQTIELPAVTAKVGKEDVAVYYSVEVFKGTSTTPYAKEGKTVLEQNENGVWEFTPYDMADTYSFKYTVKSALNQVQQTTTEFIVSTVHDTIKPKPIVVADAYETDETEGLVDASYALASTINTSEEMRILPIYAEDLGTFSFGEYKLLKRQVKNNIGKVIYEDTVAEGEDPVANKVIVLNASDNYTAGAGEIIAKDSEGKNIKLSAGTYTVYYMVTDNAGNKSETDVYHKFVVSSEYDGTVAPEVEIKDNFLSSITIGEKIEFSNVTFTDEFDTRLETEVSYTYTYNDGTEKTTTKKVIEKENGKYVIDTSKIAEEFEGVTGVQSVTITAFAKNDASLTSEDSVTIKINSTDRVITPTIITDDSGITAPIDIDLATLTDPITIPEVKFEYDENGALKVETTVTCTPTGENAEPFEVEAYQDGPLGIYPDVYQYRNTKFNPSVAGTYRVAVRAEDVAGNVIIKYFTYNVTDSVRSAGELRFTSVGVTDATVEIGEVYKLPKAEVYGEGISIPGEAEPIRPDWGVRRISGPTNCEVEKDRFIAYKTGDYVLEYYMFYKHPTTGEYVEVENQSVKINITVEDTTAPEIFVDWQTTIVNDETVEKSQIAKAYEAGTNILLPMFSASDLSGLNLEESMVTISSTAKNVSTTTIKLKDMATEFADGVNGDMYYKFVNDGEYTITYTAKDNAGKISTKSYTIKIGDTDAPVLTVSDSIAKEKYNLNDTLSFSLKNDDKNYFSITDTKDTDIAKTEISVKLMLNGVDKTKDFNLSTEEDVYNFKFTEAGSYELIFTVKDSANNTSEEVKKTFEISEKSESAMTQTEIIGTVLIVVSVVVLAGVIVYFVISKKKMDKLYKN